MSARDPARHADDGYAPFTLDGYTAAAQVDAVAMAQWMASQWAHLHLADGSVGSRPALSTSWPVRATSPVPKYAGH